MKLIENGIITKFFWGLLAMLQFSMNSRNRWETHEGHVPRLSTFRWIYSNLQCGLTTTFHVVLTNSPWFQFHGVLREKNLVGYNFIAKMIHQGHQACFAENHRWATPIESLQQSPTFFQFHSSSLLENHDSEPEIDASKSVDGMKHTPTFEPTMVMENTQNHLVHNLESQLRVVEEFHFHFGCPWWFIINDGCKLEDEI